jgi:hypothetical protein
MNQISKMTNDKTDPNVEISARFGEKARNNQADQ